MTEGSPSSQVRRGDRPLKLIVAALCTVTPILVIVILQMRTDNRLDAVDPPSTPLEAEAVVVADVETVAVEVSIDQAPATALYGASLPGIVTAVLMSPGGALSQGDPVYEVDGATRLAYQSRRPLYRPLVRGDRGWDVDELGEVLSGLGLLAPPDAHGPYDASMATAVEHLAERLGIVPTSSNFDPGWLVWLPTTPYSVAEVLIEPGQVAPGAGEAIARAISSPRGVRFSSGADLLDLSAGWVLVVDDAEFELKAGQPLPGDLSRLAALVVDPAVPVTGSLQRTEERQRVTVAVSAVLPDSDGSVFCIWRPKDGSRSYTPTVVHLGGSLTSAVEIIDGIESSDRYLVNPGEVEGLQECPSN